jgi:hypothetical protein
MIYNYNLLINKNCIFNCSIQKLEMSQDQFKHYDLTLVEPNFKSNLTDLIIELDYLRKKPS